MSVKPEKTVTAPDSSKLLWCPFCDEFKEKDSMIARKRLGLHISNKHPEEVRFPKGKMPPPVVEYP